jgi:hypothetical protein
VTNVEWSLWCQLATTLPLLGVIWLVQLVVYPQFARVGAAEFCDYHRYHSSRITWVVAPLMLGEAIAAIAFWILSDATTKLLATIGLALLLAAWTATAAIAVPAHNRLASGFDRSAFRQLTHANTARVMVWSARAVVVLYLVRASR